MTTRGDIGTRFPRITLSGVDEHTDIEELNRLAIRYPVEIAILYTVAPDGRNRYPSASWAIGVAKRLRTPLAIHVCGSRARLQILGMNRTTELHVLLPHAQRIQINGTVTAKEIATALALHPNHQIITQHHAANAALANADLGPRHALLLDGSAGSGQLPATWSHPGCSKPVGFAGGLGPDTLADQLPRIALEARGSWWVDMEQRLRSPDDWFDLTRVRTCVELFGNWLDGTRPSR